MELEKKVVPDPGDGLPAMVVGRWVTEEKHRIIKRYIDASWAARQKFTSQRTYIDLFAGTGRVKIKHTQNFLDGGPLAAWHIAQQNRGAFSDFFIADANPEFLNACDSRLRRCGAPLRAQSGRADQTIDWVLPQLNKRGIHLALLDPFNAGHLHFSIIEKLATMPTVDIVVHLSTGDIQRNIATGLEAPHSPLDNFAPGWRRVVYKQSSKHAMRDAFVAHWKDLISGSGMRVCDTMYPVRNSKESTMYWLCLIARHPLADKLWREACQLETRSLF
ncbi:three-Cys-motif partner protein TcmP [Burkholderia pseudomallei]|uniref:three-Cys-motif partner protein TcmP n=1 Tax=pseudomallei group TaxID=111527 RepID=UPI001F30308B|nr:MULTISPECIES: three-Cys-motif partner protein TcmP [pseudomallei group]MCV9914866.1 three-Cys-motif partner protein TcmP [Burkholderia pseudomallei]MCW0071133.1 three-Cys-motif partner protein TcmP [Burkholderia pseudomallei]